MMSNVTTELSVEWRPVFGGVYEVSSDGRVRRAVRTRYNQKLGEIAQTVKPNGYIRVKLTVGGASRSEYVHRLVLLAFRGPCPEGLEGAHLNGVRADNWLANLVYATHLDNEKHKYNHGTRLFGSSVHCSRLTDDDVIVILQELAAGVRGSDLARRFRISQAVVSDIKLGIAWKHVPRAQVRKFAESQKVKSQQ